MEKKDNKFDITLVSHATDTIKQAILQSQARAIQAVNQEQLALYYGIGRYVSENSRKGAWGTGIIEAISKQLKTEMPGLKGFSAPMLKRMRTFYEEWKEIERNSVIPLTEITNFNNQDNSVIPTTESEQIHPMSLTGYAEFPLTAFLNISFSHHTVILRHCKDMEARKYKIILTQWVWQHIRRKKIFRISWRNSFRQRKN